MATQQSIPQSIQQSKLSVVPFPAPTQITQLELAAFFSLRGRLHQLQQQVEAAEESIKCHEERKQFEHEGQELVERSTRP
jgi:hypothetical protein